MVFVFTQKHLCFLKTFILYFSMYEMSSSHQFFLFCFHLWKVTSDILFSLKSFLFGKYNH